MIISKNGASGIYPACTDLAYQQAVDDGADIIDCSVQMSKDGVAFCSDTADLMGDTTAVTTFISRSRTVPEIQPKAGVFSFDFTWSEIETLKRKLLQNFSIHITHELLIVLIPKTLILQLKSPVFPRTFRETQHTRMPVNLPPFLSFWS